MGERRPRRTAKQLQADIHAAVVDALLEDGYGAITFEGVARRCGVSKPVLYRRYADRAEMVLDALKAALSTGAGVMSALEDAASDASLRADLTVLLQTVQERAERIGPATYRGLVGEADVDALQEIAGLGADAAQAFLEQAIRPAQQRGDLGPDDIPTPILLAPLRVLRDQTIFGHPAVDVPTLVDEIALPLYLRASGGAAEGGGD